MNAHPSAVSVPAARKRHLTRQGTWRRVLSQQHTRGGIALTVPLMLIAVLGPLVAPHPPAALTGAPYAPASSAAWLGTDYLGHDVLSRLLCGGISVLWMSFSATGFGAGTGIILGLTAAYHRRWLDDLIMRTLDLAMAFPPMVLILLFVSLTGPRLWFITLLVGTFFVPGVARLTRGLAVEALSQEYVDAAELTGTPRWRILSREVLPNLTTPLTVEISLRLARAIMILAGISFLGFGVQQPSADWGLMINENIDGIQVQPWAILAPALCIGLLTVGLSLIGEGLARTMAGIDPRGGRR